MAEGQDITLFMAIIAVSVYHARNMKQPTKISKANKEAEKVNWKQFCSITPKAKFLIFYGHISTKWGLCPKRSMVFQNSIISWKKTVQIYETLGEISYINRKRNMFFFQCVLLDMRKHLTPSALLSSEMDL